MKHTRRIISAVLALAVLAAIAIPAYAAEVNWGSKTIYLDTKSGDYGWHSVDISLDKNSKITDVKTSNKGIIKIDNIDRWQSEYLYYEEDGKQTQSSYYSGSIGLSARKKGKATVSFKVDGKAYQHEYSVVGYENPVKSFVLTGVSKANLKSRFDTASYASAALGSNSKAGYLTVSAAKGWKVTGIWWDDNTENNTYRSFNARKGVSSAKIIVPSMSKSDEYYFSVEFLNTKTKASQSVTYSVRPD